MSNFLASLANLGTGGLYGALGGPGMDKPKTPEEQAAFMNDPEKLKAAAAYTPGFGDRLANLLSGGIYGNLSGMNQQMGNAELAKRAILEEEIQKRAMQRAAMRAEPPSPLDPSLNHPQSF